MRRVQAMAVLGTVAVAVAACSGSSGGSGSTSASPSASNGQLNAAHVGGTLHLVATAANGTLDPQVNYTLGWWQVYQAAYDGLVSFQKANGTAAFTIVPDLATSVPTPTDGGKTYTFTLRRGIKFSNGQPVTVNDVVASFQRLFKVSSPNASSWYNVLVGSDACLKTPATCTLAGGVVADPSTNTITFHLQHPQAEFLDQLAVPFGSILPASTPPKDQGDAPIPTTGAYMFSSYDPNKALVMVRNPYFKQWSAAAQPAGYPDEINYTFGLTPEAEVTAVENGQADWLFDAPPADRLGEIGSKYANQAHVNTLTAIYYLPMNVNIPPFNNEQARQAVNFALDRNAAVALYGGSNLASPSCQILPPGFPGHVDYCPYTKNPGTTWTAPDLAKAKQLVQQSGTAGQPVAVVSANDTVNKSIGEYVQSVLNSIGYKATLKPLSSNIQFTYIQNTKNKVQISLSQWYQDYPAASDFINVLYGCENFHPNSDASINISGYCNQSVQAQIEAALTQSVTDPTGANSAWAKIDQEITDQAASATLFNPKLIDFVSSRVGNYEFSKQFYMLIDQLWVK